MNHLLHPPITVRLLAVCLAGLLAGCGSLKEAKLHAPTWFGLEQMAPGIYVSREVTDQQRAQLVASIQQARSQVIEVYGSVISSPIVYACANRDCYESFNGSGDGRAVSGGFLLIPESFIPEAISHEWSHVELYARVGHSGYRRFPMWFHEGLAVAVSKLPNHSDDKLHEAEELGLPIPQRIRELGELEAWSNALNEYRNSKGISVMYSAAGHEVRGWLKRVEQQGLLELIETVNSGEKFTTAYDRIAGTAVMGHENASNQRFEADPQKQRADQPQR